MGDFSGGKQDKSTNSKSSNTTTNNNIDRRQVVAEGAVGLSADGSTVNVSMQSVDAGLVNSALSVGNQALTVGNAALNSSLIANQSALNANRDVVARALDTVAQSDATAGEGFSRLLSLADKVITGAGGIIQSAQNTTDKQMDIIATTANDAKGAIDQKTIMVAVGVAGAVAIAFAANRGK